MDWKLFDRIVIVFGQFLMRVRVCVCRVEGVVVDYAVAMLVSAAGASNVQLEYLTLQANRVENSYHQDVEEMPTLVPTFSQVRTHGGEAHHKTDVESGETHTSF